MAVAAAFLSMATVFGVAYTFGTFVEPMTTEFHVGIGATATVFAVTTFLYFALGPLTGSLADRHGARVLGLVAAAATGLGLYLASLADRLWLALLAYALGVGIGTACGYVPMVAAVARLFTARRALAVGIAVSGIGAGTLVLPPVAAVLIAHLGWRGAYRTLALLAAGALLLCAVGIGGRPGEQAPQRMGASILRSRTFVVMYLSALLLSQSLWIALVYLVPYAHSLGVSPVAAALLISALGVGSIVGRVVLAPVADRFTPLVAMKATVVVMAGSFGLWLAGPQYALLVGFAVLLGLGQGGWVSIAPTVLAGIYGAGVMGRTVGTLWTAGGVGALVGPPVGGLLIEASGYRVAIVAACALAAAGCALMLTLRSQPTSGLTTPAPPIG